MGLAQALQQVPEGKKPGPFCGIQKLRQTLTGEDLEALNAAIDLVHSKANGSINNTHGATGVWLANTLTEHGYPIGRKTVQRHLREECSCGVV